MRNINYGNNRDERSRNQGYSNVNRRSDGHFSFSEYKISDWIKNGIEKESVVFADKFGESLTEGKLTTSQIRNVFGEMRRIQLNGFDNERTSFILLKPKLAYTVKRFNENSGLRSFFEYFKLAYQAVENNVHFKNMIDLTEAVLAYHKYHGGKE